MKSKEESKENEYRTTGMLLNALALIVLAFGVYDRSAALIAIACGYWLAAGNPWKNRTVITVGLILHFLLALQAVYRLLFVPSVLPLADFILHAAAFVLLLLFYPSPYPVSSNILSFLVPTNWLVSWIESHPDLFKRLSGKGIIGTVEGLYTNSDAFNVLQEEGFLGFTPARYIIDAARKAGVQSGQTLLDVGCGTGGPSCTLAGEFGLQVTGVDLLEWNVERASLMAAFRGLSARCRFVRSNALKLPFPEKSFDFVFGSDAWCHVPGREKLLRECHRVLIDEGTIFFYDWVMNKADSEAFRFIYAFPPLETIDSYTEKLLSAGFEVIEAEIRNESFRQHVADIRTVLQTGKRRMIDICGRELYDNWDVVTAYTLKMIDDEKLGSGFFMARKK